MAVNESRKEASEKILIEAAKAYYIGEPTMSDEEWDYKHAKYIDEFGALALDGDLQTGHGYVPEGQRVVNHWLHPIVGLTKCNRRDVARQLFSRSGIEGQVVIMPKYDGGGIAISYNGDGTLYSIVTRGDGARGVDVTESLMHAVPSRIKTERALCIRGEVVLDYKTFNEYFADNAKHPRNKAVGLCLSAHAPLEEKQKLKVVVYRILNSPSPLMQQHAYLRGEKFNVCNTVTMDRVVLERNSECLEKFNWLENENFTSGVPCDGLVLAIEDENIVDEGPKLKAYGSLAYKKEVAYKFDDKPIETTVTNILWRASRTGKIVPTAEFEPIEIDGATISKATLNNFKWAAERGIGVGAKVLVERANKVIPKIVGTTLRAEHIDHPDACPTCGERTYALRVNLICKNVQCAAKVNALIERVFKFAGVKGLSSKTITKFINYHGIKSLEHLKGCKGDVPREVFKQYTDKINEAYGILENCDIDLRGIFTIAAIPGIGEHAIASIVYHLTTNTQEEGFLRAVEAEDIVGYRNCFYATEWRDKAYEYISVLRDVSRFFNANRQEGARVW